MRTSSGSQSVDNSAAPDTILLFDVLWDEGLLTKGSIDLILDRAGQFSEQHNLMVQFFDHASLTGPDQLISALYHALRGGAEGRSRTRDLSVDVVRYAAGERQISVAIQRIGMKVEMQRCVCMVFIPEGDPHPPSAVRDIVMAFLHGVGFDDIKVIDMGMSTVPDLCGNESEGKDDAAVDREDCHDHGRESSDDLADALERTALVDLKL